MESCPSEANEGRQRLVAVEELESPVDPLHSPLCKASGLSENSQHHIGRAETSDGTPSRSHDLVHCALALLFVLGLSVFLWAHQTPQDFLEHLKSRADEREALCSTVYTTGCEKHWWIGQLKSREVLRGVTAFLLTVLAVIQTERKRSIQTWWRASAIGMVGTVVALMSVH